jgi:hypothetical protein
MKEITLTLTNDMPGYGVKGQRVTLALEPQDVHDPTELPEYLAGYKPFGYRADELSVPVLVDNDSDKFRTFNSDDAFRRVDVKGSTQSAVPEVDPKSSLDSYKVVERFVGSFIPMQTQRQTGNNYRPVFASMRRCRRAIELDRELDVFALLNATASWDASVVNAAANPWTDATLGTPLTDLQDSIEASAQPVSSVWMNQSVAHIFLRHPQIVSSMRQYFGDDRAPEVANAVLRAGIENLDVDIPGLPPIKVSASKVKNESTDALDYVFANVVNLITHTPGVPADGEDIATTWTFRRRGPAGNGFNVREFFVENRGPEGGTMVVVGMADEAKMTADNAGGIITGVV